MYQAERVFFDQYRQRINDSPALKTSVSEAIGVTLERYNTTVWENRFIVGGVIEQIIGASARAVGLTVENAGKSNQGYDLEIQNDPTIGISVKGVFASVNGKHNLVNFRGEGNAEDPTSRWNTATMFVMSGVGIGYTDPEFGGQYLHVTSDALQISGKGLQEWWIANPDRLIEIEIPGKPTGPAIRVASDPVSFDVLQDYPNLIPHWRAEI